MTRAEQLADDLTWHTDDESEECASWEEELRMLDRAVPEPESLSPFDDHHDDYREDARVDALIEYGPFGREDV